MEKRDRFSSVSRRAFIGASSVAAIALASGCSPESRMAETDDTEAIGYKVDAEFDESSPGEWVPVPCWTSCGGHCKLSAYVVDGVVMRVKSDDVHADTLEEFQNRACPRGRAQRMHVFGADRIKYPMKRKHWAPGGENVHGELRGVDEWERISWDEAIELCASEFKRVYEDYGPASCLYNGIGYSVINRKLFPAIGNNASFSGCTSYGWWMLSGSCLGIAFDKGEPGVFGSNDRLDLLNAETIVLHGLNPAWASGGSPAYHLWRAKDRGAEFIFIGPEYNVSASMLNARWIPVRPGTDTAFLLAVAHEMLRLDEEQGNVVDWEFIDTCTVGFDDDSMPPDAKLNENIKGYLAGLYDGVEKTPDWAAAICGCDAADITWYAEKMGKEHAVTTLYAYSVARNASAESLPQAALTVGCLGGHFGKPGHATSPTYHYFATNDGPPLVNVGAPSDSNPVESMDGGNLASVAGDVPAVPLSTYWRDIVAGKFTSIGNCDWANGTTATFTAPEEKTIDVKMIVTAATNFLTTMTDVNNGIQAYRNAEFVLSCSFNFTTASQYADIVLPCTTPWEGPGYDQGFLYSLMSSQLNRETAYFTTWAVPPLYEARSDAEITKLLMNALGLDGDAYFEYSEPQREFDLIANATVIDDDGATYKPLVTITQEKLDELGLEGKPQEGVIDYDEIKKTGVYHVKRDAGDNLGYIAYADFVADPERNPRPFSASGKFELYSQAKADGINIMQIIDEEVKPYAAYRAGIGSYEKTFEDFENGVKGKYPLTVITPHYLRRAHGCHDNNVWLRAAFENPIFMNSLDAEERGLADGDFALIHNEWGKIVRQVSTLETIMPGIVAIPHGAWHEVDPQTGIDYGGSENVITGPNDAAGLMCAYNSVLVDIEKFTDQNLLKDWERPVVAPQGVEQTERNE